MNHLLLIASHTNSEIKKKALLHNIPYFSELCNNIVIIQSTECKDEELENNIKKINNNIKFFYLPNDKYLCHGKWCSYLNTINYKEYDNITLTNDSYLITKSLNNYKNLIQKDVELVALLDSHEIRYHFPDFLRTYNKSGIEKILKYYIINKYNISTFYDVILYYEINSSSLFNNVKVLHKSIKTHKLSNCHFDNVELKEYLYNLNYPIIKLKKLINNTYPINFKIPLDFNASEYKLLNFDLSHLNNLELRKHFINSGINDGRLYKKNQIITLPTFLIDYLSENQLMNIINDDNYNYKSIKNKISIPNINEKKPQNKKPIQNKSPITNQQNINKINKLKIKKQNIIKIKKQIINKMRLQNLKNQKLIIRKLFYFRH
jgi:hypothetical protein